MARYANKRASDISRRRVEFQSDLSAQTSTRRKIEPFPFHVTAENQYDIIRRVMNPLYDVPYEEQLESKQTLCRNAIRHIAQELYRNGTPIRLNANKLPCHFDDIVPAAATLHYRNSTEVVVERGVDRTTPTAGYLAFKKQVHGETISIEPKQCLALKPDLSDIINLINEFVRNETKRHSYDVANEAGWRLFRVDVNEDREHMLTGYFSPRGLRVAEVVAERNLFKDFMLNNCPSHMIDLKSLYFQPTPHSYATHDRIPYELLHGDSSLTHKAGDYTIDTLPDVGPFSSMENFANLWESEVQFISKHYGIKRDGDIDSKPLIIDIDCENGARSVFLSQLCFHIISLTSYSRAAELTRHNFNINNITNCDVVCGPIYAALERIMGVHRSDDRDILIFCKASRATFDRKLVALIKESRKVKKLVITSNKSDSSGFANNIIDLCIKDGMSDKYGPIVPTAAMAVDLAPHTSRCNLVLAFERLDN